MLFNLLRGYNPGLSMITGTYTDISEPQIESIPTTVTPLVIILRTTVGAGSEMAVYYRTGIGAEFTLMTGGSASATSRLYAERDTRIAVLTSGASKAGTAKLDYCFVGVNKE